MQIIMVMLMTNVIGVRCWEENNKQWLDGWLWYRRRNGRQRIYQQCHCRLAYVQANHQNTHTTRLNAFTPSCLFNASAVQITALPQTADRKNSQFFNRIVHRRLWVKVYKIFHTCRAPGGLFTVKVWRGGGGYSRKFWENRQKPGIFAFVHAKARTVFTSGGQMSRSNVGPTPCRPLSYGSRAVLSVQKFTSVPEL